MLGFIIFGTTGVTRTTGTGEFHCPSCRRPTEYRKRRVRRFFTLYFIPLIPLDRVGDYVECRTCGNQYKEEVLRMPVPPDPVDVEAAFREALGKLVALAATTRDDGPEEKAAAAAYVYAEIAGEPMPGPALDELLLRARGRQFSAPLVLRPLADALAPAGKELLVRAALLTAIRDDDLSEASKELVLEAAGALGVTRAHLRGIVEEAFSGRGPAPKLFPEG